MRTPPHRRDEVIVRRQNESQGSLFVPRQSLACRVLERTLLEHNGGHTELAGAILALAALVDAALFVWSCTSPSDTVFASQREAMHKADSLLLHFALPEADPNHPYERGSGGHGSLPARVQGLGDADRQILRDACARMGTEPPSGLCEWARRSWGVDFVPQRDAARAAAMMRLLGI